MRTSDWSSDVCSSDLLLQDHPLPADRRAGQAGARVAAHGYRAGRQGDRMKLRHGLYPRFLLLAAGVLVVVAAVVGVMLHRQATMQRDVVALSQESIHGLLFNRVQERGAAVAVQLADSLANPRSYFDRSEERRIGTEGVRLC